MGHLAKFKVPKYVLFFEDCQNKARQARRLLLRRIAADACGTDNKQLRFEPAATVSAAEVFIFV
jgi:hypothetical protein